VSREGPRGQADVPGWEAAGQTSEPFKRFVAGFYKHFHAHEKRINIEIKKKGGANPLTMTKYLYSLTEHVPAELSTRSCRLHRKALAAFERMHEAAKRDGVPLLLLSGYRPPKAGKSKNAYAKAGAWSSHSFGLALDFQLTVSGETTANHKACASRRPTRTTSTICSATTSRR